MSIAAFADGFLIACADGAVVRLRANASATEPVAHHRGGALAVASGGCAAASLGSDAVVLELGARARRELVLDDADDLLCAHDDWILTVRRLGDRVSIFERGGSRPPIRCNGDRVVAIGLAGPPLAVLVLCERSIRRYTLTARLSHSLSFTRDVPIALAIDASEACVLVRSSTYELARFDVTTLDPTARTTVDAFAPIGIVCARDVVWTWGERTCPSPAHEASSLDARGPAAVSADGRWLASLDGASVHLRALDPKHGPSTVARGDSQALRR